MNFDFLMVELEKSRPSRRQSVNSDSIKPVESRAAPTKRQSLKIQWSKLAKRKLAAAKLQ